MKLLALTLVTCVLFLSSFGGVISLHDNNASKHCEKTACEEMCKHSKKQTPVNACDGTSCALMFSCSICGFLPVTPAAALKAVFYPVDKPVTPYKMGALSEYHASGWQPPEVYV
ncbi:MAG: hypothetical protein ACTHMI_10505 [Mucilaginibacter sp.]|uniref:hypothetical protein n=1 Tax=Mucilaginibacter sp. L3T2-6 TaxID=3062491 RepID=UPI0026768FCE|nr:hypothetical protein [Mucilaginibacter sp. L3T2-6]MDO3642278.1 hypothetical protein [Mucilaginibacter sp. L3T2-6]MDV6214773.1 hypothetical protein [Mucilaginibacter sp. L3T2-6]